MRKFLIPFFAGFVFAINCAAVLAAEENRLANGSFEAGIKPWYLNVANGAAATDARIKYTSKDGKFSERIVVTKAVPDKAWSVQLSQAGIALTKGKIVTVSYWAKASKARKIEVGLEQNAKPWTWYKVTLPELTPKWSHQTFSFKVETTDPAAVFHFDVGNEIGSVVIDAVSLTTSNAPVATDPAE